MPHTNCNKTVDKSDPIAVDYARIRWSRALHSTYRWIMSVGLSARGSTNPLQRRLGQYESVPRATGAALPSLGQLSIHHYCLHAYYCSQNKRSTCPAIQKYTGSCWSAMCLTQGHTVSRTSQQGKCDALVMVVSFKWTFSHDGDAHIKLLQCKT